MNQPVLTLLEWRLKRNETRSGRFHAWAIKEQFHFADDKIAYLETEQEEEAQADEFYATPFTPEKIVEWFEGWELAEDKNSAWVDNQPFDPTHWMEFGSYLAIHIDNKDEYEVSYAPTTLSDFISDCKRAGLELVWKEEVVSKYPFLKFN